MFILANFTDKFVFILRFSIFNMRKIKTPLRHDCSNILFQFAVTCIVEPSSKVSADFY